MARVTAESGIAVPYRRTGTLDMALSDVEMRALETTAAVLAKRGVPALLLDAAGVRPRSRLVGDGDRRPGDRGARLRGGGRADAGAGRGARRFGAQLIEQSQVRPSSALRGDRRRDRRGSLSANAVVLAAGSWSGPVDRRRHVADADAPVRGQLLSLAWPGTPLRRVLWSSRCYLVPWDDGTLLVGATVEDAGFDERVTAANVRSARRGVRDRAARGRPASRRRASGCGRRRSTTCRSSGPRPRFRI